MMSVAEGEVAVPRMLVGGIRRADRQRRTSLRRVGVVGCPVVVLMSDDVGRAALLRRVGPGGRVVVLAVLDLGDGRLSLGVRFW